MTNIGIDRILNQEPAQACPWRYVEVAVKQHYLRSRYPISTFFSVRRYHRRHHSPPCHYWSNSAVQLYNLTGSHNKGINSRPVRSKPCVNISELDDDDGSAILGLGKWQVFDHFPHSTRAAGLELLHTFLHRRAAANSFTRGPVSNPLFLFSFPEHGSWFSHPFVILYPVALNHHLSSGRDDCDAAFPSAFSHPPPRAILSRAITSRTDSSHESSNPWHGLL